MKHPSPQVSAQFEYKEEHIVCLCGPLMSKAQLKALDV